MNDINYRKMAQVFSEISGQYYVKPEKTSDSEKEKMQHLQTNGKYLYAGMKKMGEECMHFYPQFKKYGKTKWCVPTRESYISKWIWVQLKYPRYKDKPFSISLFLDKEPITNDSRFYFCLEIDSKKANAKDMADFNKFFELEQPKNKKYDLLKNYHENEENACIINESWESIREKLKTGEYGRIERFKFGRAVKWNDSISNDEITKTMLDTVEMLIPYYEYICSL